MPVTSRRALLLSPLIAPLLAAEARADDDPDGFAARLERMRSRFGLPALGAVVVAPGGLTHLAVAGVRRAGETGKVGPDAHWQVGSITKTFTATLAALLVERGALRWESTLGEVFAEQRAGMAPGVADVTVRQIVLHRSGMGGDVIPWSGHPEVNAPGLTLSERRQRFVALALRKPLLFAPGTKRTYSNQGYNALGAVAERVTGKPYETLVAEELCRPLGIRSVVFGEPALARPDAEPWPHRPDGKGGWRPVPPVPLTEHGYHACNPAGGISLTLADFARWMRAHLAGEASGGILPARAFRALHTAEGDGGIPAYGLGQAWPALGRNLSHSGSNGRNFADHCLLPERGAGVFLAANAVPPPESRAAGFLRVALLADALPGRGPRPALDPPLLAPPGEIEGEALEVVRLTGGGVQFQNFPRLSGGFQLWWSGAEDGDTLVLRGRAARAGRYAVSAVFGSNRDFGAATVAIAGGLSRRLDFKADALRWDDRDLGETTLPSGPFDVTVTAHGSAGAGGIVCHLALDVLRLRRHAS